MVGTDVMEDAGDHTPDTIVEALGRIGMHAAANILALGVADGIVRSECAPDGDERLPFVAHQVRVGIDSGFQHLLGLVERQIGDHGGTRLARRCPRFPTAWPLDDRECWRLRRAGMALASAPQ